MNAFILSFAAVWISVPDAPVFEGLAVDPPMVNGVAGEAVHAAPGTSWFARSFTNSSDIVSAKWTVAGLGVFEAYVNGSRVGDDFLKPGFTHWRKTKYSFTYDVTELLRREAGAENTLAAEVSAGWWRDKIVTPWKWKGFVCKKSAFLGVLTLTYADGRRETIETDTMSWRCGVAGAVTLASIFDGEEYDARIKNPVLGGGLVKRPERNEEFKGELLPSPGGEVTLRRDLAMTRGPITLKKGETAVVDFGQNCAGVCLPGEARHDADGSSRRNAQRRRQGRARLRRAEGFRLPRESALSRRLHACTLYIFRRRKRNVYAAIYFLRLSLHFAHGDGRC